MLRFKFLFATLLLSSLIVPAVYAQSDDVYYDPRRDKPTNNSDYQHQYDSQNNNSQNNNSQGTQQQSQQQYNNNNSNSQGQYDNRTDGYNNGSQPTGQDHAYQYDRGNNYNGGTYNSNGNYNDDYYADSYNSDYWTDDDYNYTTRLRRYYRPNYYTSYYSDWYTPSYYWGAPVVVSYGYNPWYTYSRWNSWGYRPYYYDPFYYNPFYSSSYYGWGWTGGYYNPYYSGFGYGCGYGGYGYGYGYGYGGYGSGYWNGYRAGYNQAYYDYGYRGWSNSTPYYAPRHRSTTAGSNTTSGNVSRAVEMHHKDIKGVNPNDIPRSGITKPLNENRADKPSNMTRDNNASNAAPRDMNNYGEKSHIDNNRPYDHAVEGPRNTNPRNFDKADAPANDRPYQQPRNIEQHSEPRNVEPPRQIEDRPYREPRNVEHRVTTMSSTQSRET